MRRPRAQRMIFITGTDTGVGKTVLTGLLLHFLRSQGCHALAMKPFCSGGAADTDLLRAIQDKELTSEQISPFRFAEPVAPLVAARKHRRRIRLTEVVTAIRRLAGRCECLLIEGIGGLLVPLGEGFTVRDLIARLGCEVIVVSANRLGTLNHTLLTAAGLDHAGVKRYKTVLMNFKQLDASARSNGAILAELLAPKPLYMLGYLGPEPLRVGGLEKKCKKHEITLARILGSSSVAALRSL
jgi:dethiobiotin synthetase